MSHRKRYKSQEIDPGVTLGDKVVSGWHVSDTSYTPIIFNERQSYITIDFTDGSRELAVLIEPLRR